MGDSGGTTNSIGLAHDQFFKVSMSYAVVDDIFDLGGNAEGGGAEYQIVLKAVRTPDGADPTVTAALAES